MNFPILFALLHAANGSWSKISFIMQVNWICLMYAAVSSTNNNRDDPEYYACNLTQW